MPQDTKVVQFISVPEAVDVRNDSSDAQEVEIRLDGHTTVGRFTVKGNHTGQLTAHVTPVPVPTPLKAHG